MEEKEENDREQGSRHLFRMTEKSSLPRERAVKYGFRSLSDAEIMAILLGTGIKGKNVMDLANEIILSQQGHLSELMRLSAIDITKRFSGIGPGKALTLLAALELGRRASLDAAELQRSRKAITKSQDSFDLMKHHLQHLDHEEFWILMLNNSLKCVAEHKVNEGATNFTVVEVKKIIKAMIDNGANNVILFHNHPSGTLRPSVQDDNLTGKIAEAAKIFDFKVIDHIIVTDSGYYSYADEGKL